MSQALCNVIYGIPLTDEIRQEVDNYVDEYANSRRPDTFGFEGAYSANGPTSGWCGIRLRTIREGSDVRLSELVHTLDEGDGLEAKFLEALEGVPVGLRDTLPKPDFWIVWSSS